jgi:acetyl-CoA carboxylase carboxyl transferase subunit alpha
LAAEAMRITAPDLSELGCIDDIVPEPDGGAHRDYEAATNMLDASLQRHYAEMKKMSPGELVAARYIKFRNMAQFFQTES